MATIIKMPRISDTMTEGTVATWLKKVGDEIKKGDILAEIDTDKASMEFESYIDGTLLYIGVHEGKTAPVDSLIAIIGKNNDDISELIENHKANVIVNYKFDTIHHESSIRDILISKTICVILAFILITPHLNSINQFPITFNNFLINFEPLGWKWYLFEGIFLLPFLFKILLIIHLLFPRQIKIKFLNYKRSFHPYWKDLKLDKNFISSLHIISGFVFFVAIVETAIGNIPNFAMQFTLMVLGFIFVINRSKVLNKLPTFFIKQNKLIMVVDYEDYLNKKIVDDEPHIKVNQNLKAVLKKHPRTTEEKETIEIINPETPGVPALVTKIKDAGITNAISNGYELKVRVLQMREFGKLEIMLWLDDTYSIINEY
jgi:hypothetical protein